MTFGVKRHIGILLSLSLLVVSCDDSTGPDDDGPQTETLTVLTPAGGQYTIGDTIHISWVYKNSTETPFMTMPELSIDNGVTYDAIIFRSVIHETSSADTFWIVPDDSTYFSNEARIRVYHYQKTTLVGVSEQFTIQGKQEEG